MGNESIMNAEDALHDRFAQTSRVTLVTAAVNLLLSVVKVVIGFVAQSQSLVADGIHSLSDLLSDLLVYFAARHAKNEPDDEHPYGHGRFETAATLGLGVLLILAALGIAWDAVDRLFSPAELLTPGVLALFAAAFSIAANEGLYYYTIKVARRLRSDMLAANAWHHRSDAISSVVVLIGVGGTLAGLPYLDAVAAVAVGVMIAKIGWDLGWSAFQELVDAGLEEERLEKIRGLILETGGVDDIHMLRTRKMGGAASVDVHVLVEPWISVSEGHMIGQTVIDRLLEGIDEVSDVTVHVDPEDDEIAAPCKDLPLRNEARKMINRAWTDIGEVSSLERLVLHYLDGRIKLDIYFPLSLYRDEAQVAELRSRLQAALMPHREFGEVRVYFG